MKIIESLSAFLASKRLIQPGFYLEVFLMVISGIAITYNFIIGIVVLSLAVFWAIVVGNAIKIKVIEEYKEATKNESN